MGGGGGDASITIIDKRLFPYLKNYARFNNIECSAVYSICKEGGPWPYILNLS
jgi:hypothetical protein